MLSAVLVALLLTALVACTSGENRAGGPTPVAAVPREPSASPTPAPELTIERAEEALKRYLATDDVLRAGGELRMAMELVRDGQEALTGAAYRAGALQPVRYRWGEARLLVPRLDREPYWFTAVVERTEAGGGEPRAAVLTLMQEDDEARWQLSFASLLTAGAELPEMAIDAEGYATPLSSRDESIGVSPKLMAPLHATVAEEGEQGFSAELIAPGEYTTRYSGEIAERKQRARRDGLNYDSIFSATQSPIFALRTHDGGGLVQYDMSRITTLTAELPSAPWIDVPPAARWALKDDVVARELRITETHQYMTVVPPKGTHTPAGVIAYDGAVTRVTGK